MFSWLNRLNPARAPGFTLGLWCDPFCSPFEFSVLCFCVLFVLVLCLVCPMSPMSLNCTYLVVPSAFSTVYLWNTTFQPHVDFDRETPV